MKATIRKGRWNEIDEIMAIEKVCHGRNRGKRKEFNHWFWLGNSRTFVATHKGKVVAYLTCSRRENGTIIIDCCTLPAYQRNGLATELVTVAQKAAREEQAPAYCDCSEYNTPFHMLLRKLGWKAITIFRKWPFPHEDTYRFVSEEMAVLMTANNVENG